MVDNEVKTPSLREMLGDLRLDAIEERAHRLVVEDALRLTDGLPVSVAHLTQQWQRHTESVSDALLGDVRKFHELRLGCVAGDRTELQPTLQHRHLVGVVLAGVELRELPLNLDPRGRRNGSI